MDPNRTKRRLLLASSLLAGVLSLLIMNRWLVTDLGIYSFGRVWQYYVSYTDFGFIRRALIGTLLSVTTLNSLFTNEYVFSYVFYGATLVLLICLVAVFMYRHIDKFSMLSCLVVFLSPSFILQAA